MSDLKLILYFINKKKGQFDSISIFGRTFNIKEKKIWIYNRQGNIWEIKRKKDNWFGIDWKASFGKKP